MLTHATPHQGSSRTGSFSVCGSSSRATGTLQGVQEWQAQASTSLHDMASIGPLHWQGLSKIRRK